MDFIHLFMYGLLSTLDFTVAGNYLFNIIGQAPP